MPSVDDQGRSTKLDIPDEAVQYDDAIEKNSDQENSLDEDSLDEKHGFESLKEKYKNLQRNFEALSEEKEQLEVDRRCKNSDSVNKKNDEPNSLHQENIELNLRVVNISEELKRTIEQNKRLSEENERLRLATDQASSQASELTDAFQKTIDRLEQEIKDRKQEVQQTTDKLEAHDHAAKKAITALQKDLNGKVEKASKLNEQSLREKDACIVKIAKLEAVNDELKTKKKEYEKRINDFQVELEKLRIIGRGKDTDLQKVQTSLEESNGEVARLKRSVETQREESEGVDLKTKWAQNKLKQELEAHKV